MTTDKQKSVRYNAEAVNKAIASSNRSGRCIGGKEAKLIHRLLKGRTTPVNKNPPRITPGEAAQILSGLENDNADFHSLRSDEVQYLLDTAKEIGYRHPKNAGGSKARYFYSYLEKRAKSAHWGGRPHKVKRNPIRRGKMHRIKLKGRSGPKYKITKITRIKRNRVKRNPVGRFVIVANMGGGTKYYYRQTTKSFVHKENEATMFKSQAHATQRAREIIGKLPEKILSVSIGKL